MLVLCYGPVLYYSHASLKDSREAHGRHTARSAGAALLPFYDLIVCGLDTQ
jgi:hypothetical protein